MEEVKIPPPIDTGDGNMNIHLSYLRRDFVEEKLARRKQHEEIMSKLEAIQSQYVSRVDFEEHLKADEDHEIRIRNIEKSIWRWGGMLALGSAILSIVGSYLISKI